MAAELNEKQQRFVEEYMVDRNATQAAIRAGYSEKTANSQGSRLLANVKVKLALRDEAAKARKRTRITVDRVLDELAAVAFDEAEDTPASRLKYSNKLRALEMLAKHLGMLDGHRDGEEPGGGVILMPEVAGDE